LMPYADQARKRDAVRAWYARNPEARRKAIENAVVSCRSCNSKKGDRMTCGALGRNQKVLPHRTKYG
jgi:5-methylcytosine-specific restriction endonuclease McrA